MPQPLNLFSDGSFFHGRLPTFGWVAAVPTGGVLAEGQGACRNDKTNNVAAEIAGALAALRWAVEHGFNHIKLHCDLATLHLHFHARAARPGTHAEAASHWLSTQTELHVEFLHVRDSHPMVRRAHHLSRSTDHNNTTAIPT